MARGLMVVLAFAATVAHAQEAKGGGSTDPATSEGREGTIMLVARATPAPSSAPARSTGSPDAGSTIRESNSAADCSIVEIFLEGGTPVVRNYQVPSSESKELQGNAWVQPPYIKSVARCGQFYIFQIRSRSKKAWVIDRARLEGSKDELLSITALRFKGQKGGGSINVIVAEAPPGTKFSRLKLHLTGEDGRVAQPEARDLP